MNAIYGGRVDNSQDMRVLETYMELIFKRDGYKMLHFPKDQTEQRFFLKETNGLPEIDTPDTFGLPQNIDKVV